MTMNPKTHQTEQLETENVLLDLTKASEDFDQQIYDHVTCSDIENQSYYSEDEYLNTEDIEQEKFGEYKNQKDLYFFKTSEKVQKQRDNKIQKSKGQHKKIQKLKEGRCFICKKKGHRMNECNWKEEFRHFEKYCQQKYINIWKIGKFCDYSIFKILT